MVLVAPDMAWQDFLDQCWEITKRLNGFKVEADCPSMPKSRKIKAQTVSGALDYMLSNLTAYTEEIQWLALYRIADLPDEYRTRIIDAACDDSGGLACYIYTRQNGLSPSDYTQLWVKFADKMPSMRKRLESGQIVRAV